ncbi:hypothetical protein DPMN_121167, partial [Dreissena polymorpha]
KCKTIAINSAKIHADDVHQLSVKLRINMRKLKQLQWCCESEIQDLKSSYQRRQEIMVRTMNNKINSTLDKIARGTLKKTRKVEQIKILRLMRSTLDDVENTTINETKRTLLSLEASLVTGVETCIRHYPELKLLHELLLYSSDKDKKKLCFIVSRKCIDKIQQVESYLYENRDKLECAILKQTKQDTMEYLSKVSGLGRLVESMKANTDIEQCLSKLAGLARIVSRYLSHVFTVQGKSEHNVHLSSDSDTCCITAMCILPSGQVLVADENNYKVKLLNEQYRVVDHLVYVTLMVHRYLKDMCMITPREVAVAVNGYKTDSWKILDIGTSVVQFITVTQSKLELVQGRNLQLQHDCTGIAHHQGELFICSGLVLYNFFLNGKMISKLYQDRSLDRCAVSPTGDKLYIISRLEQKLVTLARDGTLLATLTYPEFPEDVHVTPECQVLICGWPSNTILQIDSEGRSKLATLVTGRDRVHSPLSVYYSSITSSIIVGMWMNNNILVFRVE